MKDANFLKRYTYEIIANDFNLAGKGSSDIKANLKILGIDPKLIRKVAIISYEAEINIVIHSYGGKLYCDIYKDKIVVISEDTGPGIPNIDLALTEGYSTASSKVRELGFGAGMGLPNMKRWSDDFEITSQNEGTKIQMSVLI